jgi:hypothetical protein
MNFFSIKSAFNLENILADFVIVFLFLDTYFTIRVKLFLHINSFLSYIELD